MMQNHHKCTPNLDVAMQNLAVVNVLERQTDLQEPVDNLRLAERVAWPRLDVIKNVFLTQSSPANDLYILDCALLGRLLRVGCRGRQI